jgi:Cu/Ag efflux pump CusA
VKDGARLRLRPKVMTVVMASSLACILIVTPVIFAWLRERDLKHK